MSQNVNIRHLMTKSDQIKIYTQRKENQEEYKHKEQTTETAFHHGANDIKSLPVHYIK